MCGDSLIFFFFFFNDTATTEIYTLSLHDALPILFGVEFRALVKGVPEAEHRARQIRPRLVCIARRIDVVHLTVTPQSHPAGERRSARRRGHRGRRGGWQGG